MIRIKINRGADGRIVRFHVDGHAQYDERGKDIVCAGVSAVTVGTVNAIEVLTGVQLNTRMKHGFLSADISPQTDADTDSKVQLLLEGMVVMLQSIQQSYGAYIAMQDHPSSK
ncbi:ribosomal-processing cysteine protease Prp [Paenibacillus filicis]|uniref:Ribosomal processing cysteine protease Prp n=1 Tax=Paenibacillus filicis TaxID=669464 RepID=A0ABU9DR80_9BACL